MPIASSDLYRITWNVIDTLYGQNLGDNGANGETTWIVQQVVKFEQELDDWVARLPDALKPVPPDWTGGPSNPARLRTIISMRYLNLRCLLHRPVVMKLLHNGVREARNEAAEGFKEKLVWQSVSTIVDAATQIITTYSRLGAQKAAVGAYWFSLYYSKSFVTICVARAHRLSVFYSVQRGARPLCSWLDILWRVDGSGRQSGEARANISVSGDDGHDSADGGSRQWDR